MLRCTSSEKHSRVPAETNTNSPEGTVRSEGEQLATVMLEACSSVERRVRAGADTPVPPHLSTQRDPEPAATALLVKPAISVAGLIG